MEKNSKNLIENAYAFNVHNISITIKFLIVAKNVNKIFFLKFPKEFSLCFSPGIFCVI